MIYQDPIKTLRYSVPEPIEVVRSKISAATAKYRPLPLWPFSAKRYLFYGNVSESSFRITRIIHFGNPHHPVAEVLLEPNPQGTTITVDLCPTFVGLLFDFMWYGLWTFFVVIAVLFVPWSGKLLILGTCVGMNLFMWVLNRAVYNTSLDLYEGAFEELFHLRVRKLD